MGNFSQNRLYGHCPIDWGWGGVEQNLKDAGGLASPSVQASFFLSRCISWWLHCPGHHTLDSSAFARTLTPNPPGNLWAFSLGLGSILVLSLVAFWTRWILDCVRACLKATRKITLNFIYFYLFFLLHVTNLNKISPSFYPHRLSYVCYIYYSFHRLSNFFLHLLFWFHYIIQIITCIFNPSALESLDPHEFEASLVYAVSSKPARAT